MTSAAITTELATFGAVQLEVTDPERSARFWQEIVGLEVRASTSEGVELGTSDETLVVLHGGARAPFRHRHSGLYHLAIHAPTEQDFARILVRMIQAGYPIAPTDHIMSKAIYLEDPDGITVEITFETPERVRSFSIDGLNLSIIDSEGRQRDGREPLDVEAVLSTLPAGGVDGPLARATKVGHVHLYTGDLDAAHDFYQGLGFEPNTYSYEFRMADLGAGGRFKHRIALNTWQGEGAPQSPPGTARMRHFTVRFDSQERLEAALSNNPAAEKRAEGYLVTDPSGNKDLLTA